METLIRYRVLLGLIWFCTVYLCPTKRTLGICGLIALYEKMPFSMSEKWRKAWCVIFFLGYFFSDNTRLFGIIWASLWEKLFSGVGGEGVSTKSVSNQSPQLKRLAWKLKFHLQQVYIWYFPKSKKKRRWSDCTDAQAGLRLCCSQTPEDRVSRVEAHIIAVFMIRAIVNELHPTFFLFCFFFLNSHRKFILFCWIVLHFICFTKRCLAN